MLQISRTANRDDRWIGEVEDHVERLQESLAHPVPDQSVDLGKVDASDLTGTVTCTVDERGEFLDLRIESDWWDSLGPSGIAPAILDAIQLALDKVAAGGLVLLDHRRPRARRPAEASSSSTDASDQAAGREPHDEWVAAEAALQRAHRLMAAADQVAALHRSSQPRTIEGPSGLVRLRLVGFTIVGCEIDVDPYHPVAADVLEEDARAVLRQAAREKDPAYWLSPNGARR